MQDSKNPKFLFQSTDTELLIKAVSGKINLLQLVEKELANRGLDKSGKWIGFSAAEKLYKIKK